MQFSSLQNFKLDSISFTQATREFSEGLKQRGGGESLSS
jgi:hypothetical protein